MNEGPEGRRSLRVGSKPVDGGLYIFDDEERDAFLRREPKAAGAIRPFLGGREFINGVSRWILYPGGLGPNELRSMPAVQDRIAAVRKFRAEEAGALGKSLAKVPAQFHVTVVPEVPFMAIAEVSSVRREYVIVGYLEPPTIPSNQLLVAVGVERWHFSIIASAMHASWLKETGGRLKSDYRYSTGLVYNTFPWPELSDKGKAQLEASGQAILDARAAFPDATLADLYDPDTMPPTLRKAHRDNDRTVDRLYRKEAFGSDRERVEHLFMLYEQLKNPIVAATKGKPKRSRRRKAG